MKQIITFLFVFISVLSFGQEEVVINDYRDSDQRDSHIASDAAGNIVIVWNSDNQTSTDSEGDIYLKFITQDNSASGDELLINEITNGDQEKPALAMNGEGNFIVVWGSEGDFNSVYDVKGRLYKNFFPVTGEILINSTTVNSQTNPDAAIFEDGRSVVVWESWYQDGSNRGVYAQRFDPEGNKSGEEFLVNTTTSNSQARPSVKYFSNGNFIVIWESWEQVPEDPSGYGVFGKIFSPDGSVILDEFQINTTTKDYQWFSDAVTFENGEFVVGWCSWEQDGYDGGIYLQRFSSSGEKLGGEVQANKTGIYYQWLPKLIELPENELAVTWSSWKQDGSREGVFLRTFDNQLNPVSFETLVNESTSGYQWEPDAIGLPDGKFFVTWSGWDELSENYDVIARELIPLKPQGVIKTGSYQHESGASTSRIYVHIVDSSKLTGDSYQVSFEISGEKETYATIRNTSTNDTPIQDFPLNLGQEIFYLTNPFEGVAVEFKPDFDFKIDTELSYFVNKSGTNFQFEVIEPKVGNLKIAPVDIAVIWGSSDTLADGTYTNPLDTAYSTGGTKEVLLPFRALNLRDNEKVEFFITENSSTTNLRWDLGEKIILMTPERYRQVFPEFHAEVIVSAPGENIILPETGDTLFILTKRPLTSEDIFNFTTSKNNISTGLGNKYTLPDKFELKQNYPNPFNPTTTIQYEIPNIANLKLIIYDILGREIKILVNEKQKPGLHEIDFNAANLASGVYIYRLRSGDFSASKKLMLLK